MRHIKVVTESVEYNCGALQLTIPDTVLYHGDCVRICIAQKPTGTPTGKDSVSVKDGRGTFTIIHNRDCNAPCIPSKLYASQLQHTPCGQIRVRQYIDVIYSANLMNMAYVAPCRQLRPVPCSEFPKFDPVITTHSEAKREENKK